MAGELAGWDYWIGCLLRIGWDPLLAEWRSLCLADSISADFQHTWRGLGEPEVARDKTIGFKNVRFLGPVGVSCL